MEKLCECELTMTTCPDQRDLVGGSQYPGMTCVEILKGMKMMQKRIDRNSDSSIVGLSPVEREYANLVDAAQVTNERPAIISLKQMVQLSNE